MDLSVLISRVTDSSRRGSLVVVEGLRPREDLEEAGNSLPIIGRCEWIQSRDLDLFGKPRKHFRKSEDSIKWRGLVSSRGITDMEIYGTRESSLLGNNHNGRVREVKKICPGELQRE